MKTSKNRGRPEKLTDEMKDYLLALKGDKPGLTAKEMHKALTDKFEPIIIEMISSNYSQASKDWIRNEAKNKLPGLNSVQKFISELPNKQFPEDNIWSMASLIDYPIPGEIIPVLVEIKRRLLEGREIFNYDQLPSFPFELMFERGSVTVRFAKWIAYLYPVLKQIAKSRGDDTDIFDLNYSNILSEHNMNKIMYWLVILAKGYSSFEKRSNILNIPFDTSKLDEEILYSQRFFDMEIIEKSKYINREFFPRILDVKVTFTKSKEEKGNEGTY